MPPGPLDDPTPRPTTDPPDTAPDLTADVLPDDPTDPPTPAPPTTLTEPVAPPHTPGNPPGVPGQDSLAPTTTRPYEEPDGPTNPGTPPHTPGNPPETPAPQAPQPVAPGSGPPRQDSLTPTTTHPYEEPDGPTNPRTPPHTPGNPPEVPDSGAPRPVAPGSGVLAGTAPRPPEALNPAPGPGRPAGHPRTRPGTDEAVGPDRAAEALPPTWRSPTSARPGRAGPGDGSAPAHPATAALSAHVVEVAQPLTAQLHRSRIEGLLLGLAAGDAAGWPAARHRAARMPEWTRRLTRELDSFAEQNATTTLPVPIALNQPPEPLRLGPSDDAEWAAFAAETVLTAAGAGAGEHFDGLDLTRRMRAAVDLAWNSLAGKVAAAAARAPEVESAVLPLRARISVRAGLGNLATGLRPPATGHDNPHYFDDAACVRAAVLAVVHPGNPRAAADLAEFDARYTQDGDGVHGARAMAAAVAAALGGARVDAAVDAGLAQLPDATEIGRNARHAVELARGADDAFSLVPLLEHQIVDHVYSYGIAAAETVPVALALATAARGDAVGAIPAAACLSRVADSAPALAGALTGALGGGAAVPAAWRDACRTLAGCALPRLAGTDLVELAGLLAHTLRP